MPLIQHVLHSVGKHYTDDSLRKTCTVLTAFSFLFLVFNVLKLQGSSSDRRGGSQLHRVRDKVHSEHQYVFLCRHNTKRRQPFTLTFKLNSK